MAGKRRSGKSRGSDDSQRWMGTYGDMVTLLMAFFVMLYAISQVDEVKFVALVSGLDVFGNTSNLDSTLDSGEALLEDAVAPVQTSAAGTIGRLGVEADPDQQRQDQKQAQEQAAAKVERRASPDQVAKVARQLDAALRRDKLPNTMTEVRGDRRGVVISVSSDHVLFALGSAELSPLGRRVIRAVAEVVDQYDDETVVEGHTDNVPLRRSGYSNWNLSTDRAVAVVERLHGRHGIGQQRLVASGYGEFRPLTPNNTAADRSRNRRVDVLLRLNGE